VTWRPSIRLRLAAIATLAAVVALVLLSVGAHILVENALINDVDSRIGTRSRSVVAELSESAGAEVPAEAVDPEYREPLLVWHFSSAGAPLAVGDLGPSAGLFLPQSVRRSPGIHTVPIGATRFRVQTTVLADGGTATVGSSLASVDHATATLRIIGGLLGLPLTLAVFAGAYLLARAALRPVENLRRTADMVGRGAASTRFRPSPPYDEVRRLAATFDRMLDRIDKVRRRQDQISADASHELRTPLAAIEAEASLALRHDRKGQEYRDSLRLIAHESRRMAGVLDGLLWLGRADGGDSAPPASPRDLGEVARMAVRRFEPIAESRGLALDSSAPSGPVRVLAPERWLDRLVDVLLDNACKYTPEGGSVRLEVSVDESVVTLLVADDGPGIPREERERLRERFERGDHQTRGTGLGLAIAEAAARATQGELMIADGDLGGASVSVRWPLAQ
jgi:signal transduction histidine kinase